MATKFKKRLISKRNYNSEAVFKLKFDLFTKIKNQIVKLPRKIRSLRKGLSF